MKVGSLFTGYGGLDMATEAAFGAETAWVSDIDPGACKILAHRYPDIPNLGDITAINWSEVEPVDIITGGSPCQDLSHAGRRAGMTDGTRSNLWVAMREAIAQIRPTYVVWENVRGAYSAAADSAVEPCPGCVGDGSAVHLRALGRVLGDLSDLGYDTQWRGLRAADVGAPHGRFRVFVIARLADAASDGRNQWRSESARLVGRPHAAERSDESVALPPSPRTSDTNGAGRHGDGGMDLRTAVTLLPTPTAADSAASGGSTTSDVTLTDAVVRTDLSKKENPRHARDPESGPYQVLPRVRSANVQEAIQREAGGPHEVPLQANLLEDLRQQQGVRPGGHSSLAGATDQAQDSLRGVRGDDASARPPQGSGCQRPVEPRGSVRDVPPTAALAGGPSRSHGVDFGQYEAAIQRWEAVLGREAPAPTEPTGRGGAHRLSPRFTEWLMGVPHGWITDVPGITRNEALKACGNGVVPQQAFAAITDALTHLATQEAA